MSESSTIAPSDLDHSTSSGRPVSVGAKSFRESTHLIPTPGVEQPRAKRYEPPMLQSWLAVSLSVLTVGLGVGLEIGLAISYRNDGFHVPAKNVFSFVSTGFLTSFFPTLLIIPFSFLWSVNHWFLRWYQPYLTLVKGNATAEQSLLLDYIAMNKVTSTIAAYKRKHWLVFVSGSIALITLLLQPLAGSVLQIEDRPSSQSTQALSQQELGLSPDLQTLNAFVASAGFAQAAVFNSLPDPPFVMGEWAVASFIPIPADSSQVNGTLTINTTGIITSVNCAAPSSYDLHCTNSTSCSIVSTSLLGCQSVVSFNPVNSDEQYGVHGVSNCSSAGLPTNDGGQAPSDIEFQPVMFWFYDGAVNITAGIFCAPEIGIFNVSATVDMTTNALTAVHPYSNYTPSNNVTGPPQNGQAFNGVVFDPSNDTFVQARASATTSEVPGAIFRFASQEAGGLLPVFQNASGFLDITVQVYRQYLSLTARSIYFAQLAESSTVPAQMTSLAPRLTIEPLSGHVLAVILLLIGFLGLPLHILHKRARRNLYLTAPPGSIAAIVSLTSRSGFGDLLLPYDDAPTIAKKLDGLRFRLDNRTGAILAEGEDEGAWMYMRKGKGGGRGSRVSAVDEAKMSLLGKDRAGEVGLGLRPGYVRARSSATVAPLPGITELEFEPFRTPYDPEP